MSSIYVLDIYKYIYIHSEEFQNHVVKLTVKPVGPTEFNVEWRLLPDVNDSIYYLLTYSTEHTNDVKFTSSNNFTLTELIECTAYTITVRCSYGVNKNMFGPFSSSIAMTSHNSRMYEKYHFSDS